MNDEKITPFDYIKSVSSTKKDIFNDGENYSKFLTNKGLSNFADSIFFANEMNMLPDLTDHQNYTYYMYSLRKKDRYSKWHKLEKNESVEVIMKYYNCNYNVAKQYLRCMKEEDFNYINNIVKGHK